MDFATRKRLYNLCNPGEPLDPTDPRNVNIEARELGVRGDHWLAQLQRRLQLSDEPICELFTGLPGSGKSTELKRLIMQLEDTHGERLLAVYIDAEQVLDLTNPIDVPDLLATIVEATERRVNQIEGKDPNQALQDGYVTRLWDWLTKTDVALKGAEFGIEDSAKLTLELKTRPSLRARLRSTIALHLTTFLQQVRAELQRLSSRATSQGYMGIVVVYDSLEKLRGISTNYAEVLDSCERVFAQGMTYVRLPVHILYTVPAALLSRSRVRVDFFPMLKLKERDGTAYEPGFRVARELVERRVPRTVLEEQLGPSWQPRLERLIAWSGGFPRELVRHLRALIEADGPLSDAAFDRLLTRVTDEYKDLVQRSEYAWLARVAVFKQLDIDNDEERRVADRLLSSNAVMRYVNGEDWWDIHPAIRTIPGVADAIAALQRGTQ